MAEIVTVTVNCSDCGRDFKLPMKMYQAEMTGIGSRAPDSGKRRNWYCCIPCLNEARKTTVVRGPGRPPKVPQNEVS